MIRLVLRTGFHELCAMAVRDREWPAHTQWYCCAVCKRLWTYQGSDVIVLGEQYALGPAMPNPEVPERVCSVCDGAQPAPILEI